MEDLSNFNQNAARAHSSTLGKVAIRFSSKPIETQIGLANWTIQTDTSVNPVESDGRTIDVDNSVAEFRRVEQELIEQIEAQRTLIANISFEKRNLQVELSYLQQIKLNEGANEALEPSADNDGKDGLARTEKITQLPVDHTKSQFTSTDLAMRRPVSEQVFENNPEAAPKDILATNKSPVRAKPSKSHCKREPYRKQKKPKHHRQHRPNKEIRVRFEQPTASASIKSTENTKSLSLEVMCGDKKVPSNNPPKHIEVKKFKKLDKEVRLLWAIGQSAKLYANQQEDCQSLQLNLIDRMLNKGYNAPDVTKDEMQCLIEQSTSKGLVAGGSAELLTLTEAAADVLE